MTELLRVALRAIGVVLPAAAMLGVVELRGGAPDGDFEIFLGAMLLSLLAAAVWSAFDAARAPAVRVLIRWIAISFVVGGGLGIGITFMDPGTPPGPERTSEAISSSLFYAVPQLFAAGIGMGLGMAVAAANELSRRRPDDTTDRGTGH